MLFVSTASVESLYTWQEPLQFFNSFAVYRSPLAVFGCASALKSFAWHPPQVPTFAGAEYGIWSEFVVWHATQVNTAR
jgi:hypothetical protein